jgi:hypothetical protein
MPQTKKKKDETALTARKLAQTPPPYGTAERVYWGQRGREISVCVGGFWFYRQISPSTFQQLKNQKC